MSERTGEGPKNIDREALAHRSFTYIQELDSSDKLPQVFPALARSKGVRQSPIRHAEGNVYIHTTLYTLPKMYEETPSDVAFGRVTDPDELFLIALALLYHDTGKKERNEAPEGARIDHVQESVRHAREDLEGLISGRELDLVAEMVGKHEDLLSIDNIPHKINKLAKLFSLGASDVVLPEDIERGRLLLKFTECDALGRIIAPGHQELSEKNNRLLQRNIELYRVLKAIAEQEGFQFPVHKLSAYYKDRISQILQFTI